MLCALSFRVLSAILALFINVTFPLDQPRQMTVYADPSPFWDTFARYDSGWYEGIARNGYSYAKDGRSNIAYFPVYPMLTRYVGRLFGRRHAALFLGGIVVSWTSFVLAMAALFHLACLDLSPVRAERAVLLTAIFPFAFFFGVVYSESTFLLFTVLAFYLFRTRRWIPAGLCAAIAIATRVTGILMWPALAWIAWRSIRGEGTPGVGDVGGGAPGVDNAREAGAPASEKVRAAAVRGDDDRIRRDGVGAVIGLVLAMTGFVWYCGYVYSVSGNPFEWAVTLERWGYYPGGPPWTGVVRLIENLFRHPYAYIASVRMAPYETLYGVTGVLFLAVVPFVWRQLGAGYGLFMLLNLLVPLSSGVFEGVGRYCSILFPCFIWLADRRSRMVSTALVVIFALFYTLGLALFTTLHPLF